MRCTTLNPLPEPWVVALIFLTVRHLGEYKANACGMLPPWVNRGDAW
jgi:hypothetical protein